MPIKVLKFWIAAFLAAVFFLGCTPKNKTEDDSIILQTLGRYAWSADDQQMGGWPGSGVEFAFEGTSAKIDIKDGGKGIMDLQVNGVSSALRLKEGWHSYTLVDSAKPQNFHIRLTRRTEVFDTGLFEIRLPDLEGEYSAFKPQSRKILFLGDSITAGFGVRGDTKDCEYNPETNAPYLSYAGLTAETFDAEPHFIAISGRGVVHNWDYNPQPVMPAQIDYALPDHPELGKWDHSQFVPDVIITALGTNDWSVIDPGRDKFRKGYQDMLSDLRARFPDAHIVTVNGPLLDGEKGAAIRDGIDWAMGELRDPNISMIDLSLADAGFVWSCNFHPGRDSMAKMARDLSAHISKQTGWDDNPQPEPILPPAYMQPDGKHHFKKRVKEIAEQSRLNGGILLAGDSITEAWLGHKDLLPDNVSNHGIGWDTVTGLRARIPQILSHDPDKIFVLIGTNDLGYDRAPQEMAGELEDFVRTVIADKPDVQIYLQSILPREAETRQIITQINQLYDEIAHRKERVSYLDLTSYFAADDGTLRAELTDDGLHLTRKGYEVWAEVLEPYLAAP